MMAEPFQLRFTPEKKDYIQASRTLAGRMLTFQLLAGLILIILAGSLLILIVPSIVGPAWRNVAWVALLVSGFYVLYFYLFIPWQLARTYQSNEYLKAERIFNFQANQIMMKVGDKSSELSWEHFEKVIEGKDLYLLIYKADQRIYPFLPKRAFTEANSEAAFKHILAEKSIPLK